MDNAGDVPIFRDYTLFTGITTSISGTVTNGAHNVSGPANFIDPLADDYHVGLGSNAIDTGLNLGITFDLDGNPRPMGTASDIGAYEFIRSKILLPIILR